MPVAMLYRSPAMSISSMSLSHLEKFVGVRRMQLPYLLVYLVGVSWMVEFSDEEEDMVELV